ncbi:unnamed protein product, partial [Didymodactylos carnosus]
SMYISEIPVRIDDRMKWLSNLNHSTSARDVIHALLSNLKPFDDRNGDIDESTLNDYTLYVHTDRGIHPILPNSKIYKVVASIQKRQCGRRLLFEIKHRYVPTTCLPSNPKYAIRRTLRQSPKKQKSEKLPTKKRVRFSDEIQIQDIRGRHLQHCNESSPLHFLETLFIPDNKHASKNVIVTNNNDEAVS